MFDFHIALEEEGIFFTNDYNEGSASANFFGYSNNSSSAGDGYYLPVVTN